MYQKFNLGNCALCKGSFVALRGPTGFVPGGRGSSKLSKQLCLIKQLLYSSTAKKVDGVMANNLNI